MQTVCIKTHAQLQPNITQTLSVLTKKKLQKKKKKSEKRKKTSFPSSKNHNKLKKMQLS